VRSQSLSRRPFRDEPEIPGDAYAGHAAFYHNPVYTVAWNAITAAIAERSGPVVIIGDSGLGKSHLLHRVAHSLPQEVLPVYLPVYVCNPQVDDKGYTPLDPDSVLSHIAEAIIGADSSRVTDSGDSVDIRHLRACLDQSSESDHHLAIFVDDAHGLSKDLLVDLFRLAQPASGDRWLLGLILAGLPPLETRLRHPELRILGGDEPRCCRLEPLGLTEIGPYVQKCFGSVHTCNEELLSSEASARIAAYSRGIPRLIINLFNAALFIAKSHGQTNITEEIVEEATGVCFISLGLETPRYRGASVVAEEKIPLPGISCSADRTPVLQTPKFSQLVSASGSEGRATANLPMKTSTQGDKPMDRTENLNRVLKNLQVGSPDVEASALITEDGLMIASALPQDLDETRVGGMSATLLSLGTRAASELRRGEVREIIVRGEQGYTVMINAGRGVLLLVVANEHAKLGLIFFDMQEAINAINRIL
jgi:predicted regulator of Ras-like GTPase activity (Roadblock/LC7/MglB family)/type II secretory pathway predicted ATPase ExeA